MAAQEIVRANRDAKVGREAPGALILGGAHGSLAVARSLGRRGIPVWFATHDHPIRETPATSHAVSSGPAPPTKAGRIGSSSFPQVIGPSAGCCYSSPGTTRCCNGPIASLRRYGKSSGSNVTSASLMSMPAPSASMVHVGRDAFSAAPASHGPMRRATSSRRLNRSSAGPYRPANIGRRRDRPRSRHSRRTTPCPGSWICRS